MQATSAVDGCVAPVRFTREQFADFARALASHRVSFAFKADLASPPVVLTLDGFVGALKSHDARLAGRTVDLIGLRRDA
jgi:invasion protein IalB